MNNLHAFPFRPTACTRTSPSRRMWDGSLYIYLNLSTAISISINSLRVFPFRPTACTRWDGSLYIYLTYLQL